MPTLEGQTKKLNACEAKLASLKDKKKNRVKRKPGKYALAYKAFYAKNGRNYARVQDAAVAFGKIWRAGNKGK